MSKESILLINEMEANGESPDFISNFLSISGLDKIGIEKKEDIQVPLTEETDKEFKEQEKKRQEELKKMNTATQYSSPFDVIKSDVYEDGSYAFFDQSDKDATADLNSLFGGTDGEFTFKQKFIGEGGGLQAVEVTHKESGNTTSFDVGIGDMFNLYGGGQYLSKTEGRNKSLKILNDFISANITEEGIEKANNQKRIRKNTYNSVNNKVKDLAYNEVADINTKFYNEELFTPTQTTNYVAPKNDFSQPKKIVSTSIPYKKELEQAKKELLYDKESDASIVIDEKSIQARAKEIIINKIEDNYLTEVLKNSDLINDYELASKEFSVDLNKDLALLQHKDHDFQFGEIATDYIDIKTKLEDTNHKFEYTEGEDLLQLQDGRIVPKRVIDKYDDLILQLNSKARSVNSLRQDVMERAMSSEDNSRARDIARRNYNGLEEFFVETGLGLVDQFAVNIPYGLSTLGRGIMGVGPDKESSDAVLQIKSNLNKIRDSYSKDIEFDDAFSSLSNFGTFAAQELSNQIPVFAALAMPGGLGILGTSSFGDQYSNLTAERRTPGGRQLSDLAMFWMSVGYGGAEVVFEGLTTLPLIRAAKRSFIQTPGKTTLYNTNFKKYFSDNINMVALGTVGEPIAEGLTQISQNAIDGKSITENLDHAMFSGLMFGTTLSAIPFTKGLYTAHFNDGAKTQEIRLRTRKMMQIKKLNDQLKRNLNIGTAQQKKQRKDKIKQNEARFKELYDANVVDMKAQEKKLKTLSEDALREYITATTQQQGIKIKAEQVINDNTLSQAEKTERLKELQAIFNEMQGLRDVFRDTKTFGSEWHAYQANRKNKNEVSRIKEQALNDLISEGKKDPSQTDIDTKAKIIFNSEKIRKDHAKNKSAGATNSVLVETATDADVIIDEAIDKRIAQLINLAQNNNVDVSEKIKQLEIDRKAYKKGLREGNHGVTLMLNFDDQVGRPVNNIPITVVENSAKDDRLEVRTHEAGHDVFIKTLSTDPAAYDDLASTALTWLQNNNKAAFNRVALKLGDNIRSDEAIMYFLEEVAGNKVDISKNSVGGLFGFLLNKGIKANNGAPVDFKGETDAVNFLINVGKKIKDGTLNNEDLRAIRENMLIKDGKAEARARAKTAPKFSEARAKENLQKLQDALVYDPSSRVLADELPGMAMAQINNYFAARPKLVITNEAKQELQAEIISRLYTPSKTGRSDVNGFDGRGTLYGYLNGRIRFRMLDAFQQNPTIVPDYTQKQIEEERTKLQDELDKPTDLDNTLMDQNVTKVNVLQIGKIASKRNDIVKVVNDKGTFRDVIDNNEGKVGNIIFGIPENKIANRNDNITVEDIIVDNKGKELTKAQLDAGQTGIPVRSEAKRIQDFFANINTVKNFIKIMPKTNVSEKDADINKLGENIEVSRDTLGRAIGLPNLILEYFYNKKFKPDGKRARSQGKSSQVALWDLKPEFTNLSETDLTKAAEQLQEDLGVGETSIPRSGKVKSGQFVKGAAVVMSQQASLSAAQRKKEQQLKQAEQVGDKARVKEIKQEIADVTAAQSKLAFSESRVNRIYDAVSVSPTFEGDLKKADTLLSAFIEKTRHKFVDEKSINDFFKDVENILIRELPQGLVTKRILKPSPRVLGAKRDNEITVNGKKLTIEQYYTQKRDELFLTPEQRKEKGLKPLKYGKPFTGKAENFKARVYGKVFGNSPESFRKANEEGKIKAFNEENASMHRQLWQRINKSIQRNPNNARVWGNYFGVVSLVTEHPHRLGAEWVGWSSNPEGYEGKLYEWEHAMPATRAYLYLLEASLDKNYDFDTAYELVMRNFKLVALDNKLDKVNIKQAGRTTSMGIGWNIITDSWLKRYFDKGLNIDPKSIEGLDGRTFDKIYKINKQGFVDGTKENIEAVKTLEKAMFFSRTNRPSKGITVLDFDDTLATTKSLVKYTKPDGTTGTLNAEEYASTYEDLLDKGYKFDFSDFNKVVKGKLAPLFNKAMKLQGKFGPENMFVLTARPPQAQKAIFDFLKANGLNIPLKNITGLGNSTAEAKALWIADKVGEGYNDFYFADDALQNVQAVKNMLDQFDVKSKVQQAKLKFSKTLSNDFNKILENVTGIESQKRFSDIKARKRGSNKGKFRFFIPPSHEDFIGLLYNFMGKGKEGNKHRDFFEEALVRPLNRAYREIDTAKQAIANDYKALNKKFPEVKGKLTNKTPDGDFTFQDAIRVYIWNKHGYSIPGLTPTDQTKLVEIVNNDADLKSYAEAVNLISKQDFYVDPGPAWEGGNIRIDLIDATGRVGRDKYFEEFNENAEIMFSLDNLNKIEAAYGYGFREALEDMLYRIRTGINRPKGQGGTVNKFMNYLNGSVGTVMFFNIRSAVLQQMSIVNYLNFADNNIFAAAKAFANQKQYWSDFAMIFNSDMLKQRRGGIGTDINGAELAEAVNKAGRKGFVNQTQVVIGKLLKLGFLPTQIGDNIAIATGGATYYRNRVNKYIKDGLSKKEAEIKAFVDFQNITQSTQQSSRPDMSSQQQAAWMGKLVLNFLNTPSQYNRIIKKAGSDIINRRITPPNTTQVQSDASNLSRILYYGAIQNIIFYSLQSALFAVMFGSDDEDGDKQAEKFLQKKERVINGAIDTILRGSGIYGVAVSTLKNMVIKFLEQREPKYNKDEAAVLMELLNFSPVLGIKARQIVNAEKTLNYNENIISEMETFEAENPMWSAVTNYTQALTNVPANRLYQKGINVRNSLDNDYEAWQRVLFFTGYTTWSLGLGDTKKIIEVKETVKEKKKQKVKEKREQKKLEKKQAEEKIVQETIKQEKEKEKKGELKDPKCVAIKANGERCGISVAKAGDRCTIHEKVEQRVDGKKTQCKKIKNDGKRCKMQTSSKSGLCYYHD